MPASMMTLFPQALAAMEGFQYSLKANIAMSDAISRMITFGFDMSANAIRTGFETAANFMPESDGPEHQKCKDLLDIYQDGIIGCSKIVEENMLAGLKQHTREKKGELDFVCQFTQEPPAQHWDVDFDEKDVLLDLPGMRLIDISADTDHLIDNYTVVFAPRAGHHSNIAERTAIYMRENGLTRMAIVEQKCANDIPLFVDGQRHYENFDGQVSQYRQMLTYLKDLTGHPPHLVAVCQPGPLLISTLILYPELGRTFGSAGSPMDTDVETGFLTDFARLMGKSYIDKLMAAFPATVGSEEIGAGREIYDGRLQVLGFYILGIDQHTRNLSKLLEDLKSGRIDNAERQKQFYAWYNHALHFPAGFIRDTFKKIFVGNELIRGTMKIHGRTVRIKDYPAGVPIWALGGTRDNIAPPRQAIGHVDHIDRLSASEKVTYLADAGHMGLFRSHRVLREHYSNIVNFIKSHSDYAYTRGDQEMTTAVA